LWRKKGCSCCFAWIGFVARRKRGGFYGAYRFGSTRRLDARFIVLGKEEIGEERFEL
jgi:hypothetical protein